MTELLLLALVGGVVAVDGVAAVKSMISRPFVVGWVVGLLLGEPVLGGQIGILLEVYLLVAVPSGGGRQPEGGIATVVAVGAATAVAPAAAAAGLGVAAGLGWGWIAGESQALLRRWNARRADDPARHLGVRDVVRAQLLGLGADFGRGAVLAVVGVVLARILAPILAGPWPASPMLTWALVSMGALASLGIVLRGVAETRGRAVLFGVGLLAGAFLLGGA